MSAADRPPPGPGPAELARPVGVREALAITPDECGRIMHESWMRTKRAQGFHGRYDICRGDGRIFCPVNADVRASVGGCRYFHADLIPWEQLPERQKDINRHAFDDVLAELRRRVDAALATSAPELLRGSRATTPAGVAEQPSGTGCEGTRAQHIPLAPEAGALAEAVLKRIALDLKASVELALMKPPCLWCEYRGENYWQRDTHAATCPWRDVGGYEARAATLPEMLLALARATPPRGGGTR